jgi:hypothetical protein
MSFSRSAKPLPRMLAAVILGAPAFCATLNNVPVGQYLARVNYADPCCVLSTIAEDTF